MDWGSEISGAKLIDVDQLLDELDEPDLLILDATVFLTGGVDGGRYVVESGRSAFDATNRSGGEGFSCDMFTSIVWNMEPDVVQRRARSIIRL